jgi:hypothetical protein
MRRLPGFPPLLTHQGGWDEMLLIVLPLVLFVAMRWLAARRKDTDEAQTAERNETGRDG